MTLRLIALDTGPGRPVSLELSDTQVYEPQMRARVSQVLTTLWLDNSMSLKCEPALPVYETF